MKVYRIYTAEEFERDFNKLDRSVKKQIEKEIGQLETNPYVGKPLGYKFFREKKVGNHRFYYLIYEEYLVVFLIALSDKKQQQKVIDTIKSLMPYYRKEIEKKFNG